MRDMGEVDLSNRVVLGPCIMCGREIEMAMLTNPDTGKVEVAVIHPVPHCAYFEVTSAEDVKRDTLSKRVPKMAVEICEHPTHYHDGTIRPCGRQLPCDSASHIREQCESMLPKMTGMVMVPPVIEGKELTVIRCTHPKGHDGYHQFVWNKLIYCQWP